MAGLQPFAQLCVLAEQVPKPSQTAALVLVVPEQEALAPHNTVASLLVVSEQDWIPVEQEVVPFLHGLAGVQLWLGIQAPQLPPRQNLFVPHIAPSSATLQAPEPSHLPLWQFEARHAESDADAGLPLHVPGVPRLHALHAAQLAVPQQTPSTQLPVVHSVPLVHARPSGLLAWHLLLLPQ